jgi:CPA1 family monovalent cation:H+ antiporter
MRTLEVVVVVLTAVSAITWIAHRLRWNSPLLLVAAGCLIGLLPEFRSLVVPPDVVLLLFLPALLYWESLTTSLREIRTNVRAILLLATGLVLATAAAVAAVAHALDLWWPLAFVLGAVVAPTDATAVAAVAVGLPRRLVVSLRAESLINDGTALTLFAVVVGMAVGGHEPTWWDIAGEFLLAYGGGIAIGALAAAVVVAIRRRLEDRMVESALSLLVPFAVYLPAQAAHASGVLAVVTCGLLLSQWNPRILSPTTRVPVTGFWELTTFVLNGALFVLVGIQTPAIITSAESGRAIGLASLVTLTVIGTRLLWLYSVPYLIRAIDRRPRQRELRYGRVDHQLHQLGARQRFPIAWCGARGAVSLAAALAVPARVDGRDTVVFTAVVVIVATLLIQGQTMPAVIRWARFSGDEVATEEEQARRHIRDAAIEALPRVAASLETPAAVADLVAADLRRQGATDGSRNDVRAELELRRGLLGIKRRALIQLRDDRRIDDIVLRRVESVLDTEEIRIDLALRSA